MACRKPRALSSTRIQANCLPGIYLIGYRPPWEAPRGSATAASACFSPFTPFGHPSRGSTVHATQDLVVNSQPATPVLEISTQSHGLSSDFSSEASRRQPCLFLPPLLCHSFLVARLTKPYGQPAIVDTFLQVPETRYGRSSIYCSIRPIVTNVPCNISLQCSRSLLWCVKTSMHKSQNEIRGVNSI